MISGRSAALVSLLLAGIPFEQVQPAAPEWLEAKKCP
jgi:hypothetical protein